MRPGIWIVLLSLGTILGFGAGFARMCGYGGWGHGFYGHGMHHRGFFGPGPGGVEERAADACVRAAERVLAERHAPAGPKETPPAEPSP